MTALQICQADRVDLSRWLVEQQLNRAMDIYRKNEPDKGDSWRNTSIEDMMTKFHEEREEMENELWNFDKFDKSARSKQQTLNELHDTIAVLAMVAALVEEKGEK